MKITGNEPAYGGKILIEKNNAEVQSILGKHSIQLLPVEYSGLTIRQQFAMAAMQGILSNSVTLGHLDSSQSMAVWSVQNADALIAELNRTEADHV